MLEFAQRMIKSVVAAIGWALVRRIGCWSIARTDHHIRLGAGALC